MSRLLRDHRVGYAISPWKHGPTRSISAHIAGNHGSDELRTCGEGDFPDNAPLFVARATIGTISPVALVRSSPALAYGCDTCTTRAVRKSESYPMRRII